MASEACGSMIRNRCERDGHEFCHSLPDDSLKRSVPNLLRVCF